MTTPDQPVKPQEKPVASPPSPAPSSAPASAKPTKKVRVSVPIYKYYEIKDGRAERLRRDCPRCGKGTFLAEHKDRLTCGKCGYTSYKKTVNRTF